jgi:uncharacterized protein YeaO (DUF488 family)
MAISIVRLGSPRRRGEGLRIGTVRRPPRGVPKTKFASENWYDVWLPTLAPSAALMQRTAMDDAGTWWRVFAKRFQAELNKPEASRLLDVLAALSHQTSFSVGCYCEDERHCHRSLLRRQLSARGAIVT